MTGIFQIERHDFWFFSDAGFKPNNINLDKMTFASTKATCLLGPVKRDKDYAFTIKDFSQITANIIALQKLMARQKGEVERFSALMEFGSDLCIKLSHTLFKAKLSLTY
jgi:hypothetical protein